MLIARLIRPDCYRVAKVLQAYLDGEVDAATAGDVSAHLEHCRRCGLEAGTYRAIKSAIAASPSSEPGAGGPERPDSHPADAADAARQEAVARLRQFAISLAGDGPAPAPDSPAPDSPAPDSPSGG